MSFGFTETDPPRVTPPSADSAQPAPRGGYNHLGGRVYGSTSGSARTEMISNACAAVAHPESLTDNVTQKPVLQKEKSVDLAPQVPLSVAHHISCSLHFVTKRGYREKMYKQHTGKKPSIYSQPKIAANNLMYHSVAANSLSVTCYGTECDSYHVHSASFAFLFSFRPFFPL